MASRDAVDPERVAQPSLASRLWERVSARYSDGLFWTSRLYRATGVVAVYVAYLAWAGGEIVRAAASAALVLPLVVTGRALHRQKPWAWKAGLLAGVLTCVALGVEAVRATSWLALLGFVAFGLALRFVYRERPRFLGIPASQTIPLRTNAPSSWPSLKTSEGLEEAEPSKARAMLQMKIGAELEREWEDEGGEVLAFGESVSTPEGPVETDILARAPDGQRWALFVFPRPGGDPREQWSRLGQALGGNGTPKPAYFAPEALE